MFYNNYASKNKLYSWSFSKKFTYFKFEHFRYKEDFDLENTQQFWDFYFQP